MYTHILFVEVELWHARKSSFGEWEKKKEEGLDGRFVYLLVDWMQLFVWSEMKRTATS